MSGYQTAQFDVFERVLSDKHPLARFAAPTSTRQKGNCKPRILPLAARWLLQIYAELGLGFTGTFK